MASAKDTFEAVTFGAGTFASGAWRGSGVAVQVTVWGQVEAQISAPGSRQDILLGPGEVEDQLQVPGSRVAELFP